MLMLGNYGICQFPSHRMYTMRDGLSQMKITDLHLDSRGYLWIGTRNGLNKFDGENFSIYTSQDGLSHDRIHNITEDPEGNLVILTYKGIDIFDGQSFSTYAKDFNNVLYDLVVTTNGDIWVCDKEIEKKLWLLKEGAFQTLYHNKDNMDFLSMAGPSATGKSFFSCGDTLFQLQAGKLLPFYILPNKTSVFNGLQNEIYLHEKKGDLITISQLLQDTLARIASYTLKHHRSISIGKNKTLNTILQAKVGLFLPSGDGKRLAYTDVFSDVRDVIKDNHGQLWLASDNGLGLVYNDAFFSYSEEELPNIWTVVEDKESNIWFGSFGDGLYYQPSGTNTIKRSFNIGHCFAGSACDRDGKLYFAHEYNLAIVNNHQLSYNWDKTVFAVQYDRPRDQLVFGTFEGVGIKKGEAIQYLGIENGIHENGYIQNVGIDKKGNYWAGSYTGVTKIDPLTGQCSPFTLHNGKLPCNGVFCTHQDAEGNLWLGGDEGLMFYDFALDSIIKIKSHVVSTRVKSITDFDDQHLILGTKDGIYIFDKMNYLLAQQAYFYFFNASNGYEGIDPGFTGMYKDSKGKIWISSATNLVKLDPSKLKLTDQSLDPRITHFNHERIGFKHDSLFQNTFGKNAVVIQYEATGFNRPFATKFQYRINKGKWSEWTEANEVILNDLNPGKYEFEVRAGPTDQAAIESKTDKLSFEINLPFFRHPWFPPVGVSFVLLLLGLAAYYFSKQRLEHRQYIQQLKEARYLRSQLLLAELNPHFIFNVLSSIQHKVLFEEKELAAEYVVKLSKLMRNYLNASHKANQLQTGKPEYEIPLTKEIELLRDFTGFEKMKNNDHFDFHLEIDPALEPDYLMIPPMLIQPFVENAIKHGLLLSEKKGNLWIKFKSENSNLICIIEDDGVGREEARKRKSSLSGSHKSLGSKIVMERVEILNKLGYNIIIETHDRKPHGTIVKIKLMEEL